MECRGGSCIPWPTCSISSASPQKNTLATALLRPNFQCWVVMNDFPSIAAFRIGISSTKHCPRKLLLWASPLAATLSRGLWVSSRTWKGQTLVPAPLPARKDREGANICDGCRVPYLWGLPWRPKELHLADSRGGLPDLVWTFRWNGPLLLGLGRLPSRVLQLNRGWDGRGRPASLSTWYL